MQTPFTPTPARAALTCLLAAAVACAAPGHAAEPLAQTRQAARAYEIGAGPLASVLGQFAAAAGVALSYDPASTRQRQSGGLRGSYTVGAGFAAILAGSGLEAVEGGAGEFIVRKAAMPATAGAAAADATELPAVRVVARAAPAPVDADERYQPTPDASSLRTTAPVLQIPQVVNVVPAQVIRDQRPRNLDEALANVSGVTQGNTLASTQDTIMKRGFGTNRDGLRHAQRHASGAGARHERRRRERGSDQGPVLAAVRPHGPGRRDQRGQQEAAAAPAHGAVAAGLGLRGRAQRHGRPRWTPRAPSGRTVWPTAWSSTMWTRTTGATSASTARRWWRRRWPGMATTRRPCSGTNTAST